MFKKELLYKIGVFFKELSLAKASGLCVKWYKCSSHLQNSHVYHIGIFIKLDRRHFFYMSTVYVYVCMFHFYLKPILLKGLNTF
jgi:hypothetical protein